MAKQNRRLVDMGNGARPKAAKGKQANERQHVNKYRQAGIHEAGVGCRPGRRGGGD